MDTSGDDSSQYLAMVQDAIINNSSSFDAAYMDTKTGMLEVAHEEMKLSLEVASIKEKFLELLKNYEMYKNGVRPNHDTTVLSAKSRIREIYKQRKSRLEARRNLSKRVPEMEVYHSECRLNHAHTVTQTRQIHVCENNNNQGSLPCIVSHDRNVLQNNVRQTDENIGNTQRSNAMHDENGNEKPFVSASKLQTTGPPVPPKLRNLHTSKMEISKDPIKLSRGIPEGSPRLNERRIKQGHEKLLRSSRDTRDCMSDGEYVSLRSSYVLGLLAENARDDQDHIYGKSVKSILKSSKSSANNAPVKYATSDAISKLYTTLSIGEVNKVSPELKSYWKDKTYQSDDCRSLDGTLDSSVTYPPHNTPNESSHRKSSPYRISVSAPTSGMQTPNSELDNSDWLAGFKLESSSTRDSSFSEGTILAPGTHLDVSNEFLNSSKAGKSIPDNNTKDNSSKQKIHPMLCKEHGLHPTYNGKCIFDDNSSSMMDSDTTQSVRENDYDSSYLSECADDGSIHGGKGHLATYDSKRGRMKLLKRQSGSADLKSSLKKCAPIISESETSPPNDDTETALKHLSIVANRASIPDLANLFTSPSPTDNDTEQYSTLSRASSGTYYGVVKCNAAIVLRNINLARTMSNATSTTCTTETSNARSPVAPLNTPINTDSSNSGSRPTTDTYDYIDLPLIQINDTPSQKTGSQNQKVARMSPANQKPGPQTQRPSRLNSQAQKATFRSRSHSEDRFSSSRYSELTESSKLTASNQSKLHRSVHDLRSDGSKESGKKSFCSYPTTSSSCRSHEHDVPYNCVSYNLPHDKKKAIAKRIKKFNDDLCKPNTNINIRTLGHF